MLSSRGGCKRNWMQRTALGQRAHLSLPPCQLRLRHSTAIMTATFAAKPTRLPVAVGQHIYLAVLVQGTV